MNEPAADAVLPHERWAELEREDLQDRQRRPQASTQRLPIGGRGEETNRRFSILRTAIPLVPTLVLPVLLVYVVPMLLPLLIALHLAGARWVWPALAVAVGPTVPGVVLLWVFRDRLAEAWSQRHARRLRQMRSEMITGAFGRNCVHMTQVGVRYGLERSDPPGSFHDFIGFIELTDHGIEVWWARGKQVGGFLIPRSCIVRVWPVEIWTRGSVPSPLRPPAAMVPYVEFRDPRTSKVHILSFESAEEVTPDGILTASRQLADQLCLWFCGQLMDRIWVPPSHRGI